ncbi:hypothetical protein GGR03_000273 [Aurantimonas endophytica]|uniref:Uncharacterized protein n=1 Tax=Aurantimonas endophytica TaxID=1522175 RepID=A0A7W6H9U1_9HYPH|nr:hypothetical protein [Aurantimonas endophytica]
MHDRQSKTDFNLSRTRLVATHRAIGELPDCPRSQHHELEFYFVTKYAGLTPKRVWYIEGGLEEPTPEERQALAIAHGVDESVLRD